MISTLLPLASIALKVGAKLLSSSAKPELAQQSVQKERLAPTVQSLFQRLGVKDADSEQNRAAINHFMGELMQTLGQENNGQSLPAAIDSARSQLANGTQSTRFDALQSELDTLKDSLGTSDLNLDQLLGAFKQTLPNGKGRGLEKFLIR
jgi:predicted  nucleic acid-binding Zn-ribbon protein